MLNRARLAERVKKAVGQAAETVAVERAVKNEFGEPCGKEKVAELTGHFYVRKNSFLGESRGDAGTVKSGNVERFLTPALGAALEVLEGDEFELRGARYKIVDKGNAMDVYFDFALGRV